MTGTDPSSRPDRPGRGEDEGPTPRRRRHRRAFGGGPAPGTSEDPVLPDRSRDDSDVGWGDRPPGDDDDRLRREVPPHW